MFIKKGTRRKTEETKPKQEISLVLDKGLVRGVSGGVRL